MSNHVYGLSLDKHDDVLCPICDNVLLEAQEWTKPSLLDVLCAACFARLSILMTDDQGVQIEVCRGFDREPQD